MLSNLTKNGSNKINLASILGIIGIFLLGPLGYFSIGNIYVESIIDGNYYFDPALTGIWNIVMTINLLYLFALTGGIPCMVMGLIIGKYSGRKVLGMEIGLVSGMIVWPLLSTISLPQEMSLYSVGGLAVGVMGCYLGRKVGQHAGNVIMQKVKSK